MDLASLWKTIHDRRPKSKFVNLASKIFFACLAISFGLIFTYNYFLYTHEYPPGSYERIAAYEADKVFQTRFLITALANFLIPLIPIFDSFFGWMIPYPMSYEVVLQMINTLFLAGLLMLMPKLMKVLDCSVNPFWTLLTIIPVSWNYIFINGYIDGAGLYYPYDIPSLTFFALGTILFANKKWLFFYPVFILACLNRESACFISMAGFFILMDLNGSNRNEILVRNKMILLHVSFQALLWLTSRILLSYAFRNNPGDFFEEPHSMIDFLLGSDIPGGHWAGNPSWFLTLFAGIWVFPLIFYRRLTIPSKRFLTVGVIYLFVLIFRSNMMETRVYNELNVILSASALIAIFNRSPNLKNKELHA